MTVGDFLRLTQGFTVPMVVLSHRADILQRIADACGRSIKSLCLERQNLALILSNILLQRSGDAITLVMSCFAFISLDLSETECMELFKGEPYLTAAELLKAAADICGQDSHTVSHSSARWSFQADSVANKHGNLCFGKYGFWTTYVGRECSSSRGYWSFF